VDQKGKLSDVPYDKYTGRILEELSRRKTPRDKKLISKREIFYSAPKLPGEVLGDDSHNGQIQP
jgi:hypothetical protein